MKNIKIIIDDKIPFIKGRLEALETEGVSFDVVYAAPETISAGMVADADAIIVRTRTRCDEKLLKDSAVRLVVTATIGTDHIDIPWCESRGIKVCNAAGCNAPGVAQYVWSSLLRMGFDPSRHTLGVVGVGHVGSIVADWGSILVQRFSCVTLRGNVRDSPTMTISLLISCSGIVTRSLSILLCRARVRTPHFI